ncbi:hypothetical protein H5410_035743 [Solanum commersonii]|uniref:Uncharacterized protein n=1 Tax=Solanum commersonii TaxID=4109 RepID=A0A9J5Y3Q4_SOLCO|nr:hypothetical protein H5410_035743 [Solanum commersonii]
MTKIRPKEFQTRQYIQSIGLSSFSQNQSKARPKPRCPLQLGVSKMNPNIGNPSRILRVEFKGWKNKLNPSNPFKIGRHRVIILVSTFLCSTVPSFQ